MQSYKDVCGKEKCVWFEISPSEGEQFLKWAKDLGCVWHSGKEIEPEKGADFLHLSIRSDGTVAYVSMMIWFADHPQFKKVERCVFSEYIKGKKVRPTSRLL